MTKKNKITLYWKMPNGTYTSENYGDINMENIRTFSYGIDCILYGSLKSFSVDFMIKDDIKNVYYMSENSSKNETFKQYWERFEISLKPDYKKVKDIDWIYIWNNWKKEWSKNYKLTHKNNEK